MTELGNTPPSETPAVPISGPAAAAVPPNDPHDGPDAAARVVAAPRMTDVGEVDAGDLAATAAAMAARAAAMAATAAELAATATKLAKSPAPPAQRVPDWHELGAARDDPMPVGLTSWYRRVAQVEALSALDEPTLNLRTVRPPDESGAGPATGTLHRSSALDGPTVRLTTIGSAPAAPGSTTHAIGSAPVDDRSVDDPTIDFGTFRADLDGPADDPDDLDLWNELEAPPAAKPVKPAKGGKKGKKGKKAKAAAVDATQPAPAPAAAQPKTESIMTTLRRGIALAPELYRGLAVTLVLAVVMTAGRVVVPIAIQEAIDSGIRAPGGPNYGFVGWDVGVTAGILVLTTCAGFFMTYRLFTASERALAKVRTKMFRHVHSLSMLHQQGEQRGNLVSRVTGDVDSIGTFLQWNGVVILISTGQVLVTTVVMAVYSWQLTLVVVAIFLPIGVFVRRTQQKLVSAFTVARRRMGALLGILAESVVGAPVIRAYNVSERTRRRLDRAIDESRTANEKSMELTVTVYTVGELGTGLSLAGVLLIGLHLGVGGSLSLGQITAFLFLVTLFISPIQVASEMLNDAVAAVAGWRRVLDVLDIKPDIEDPVDGVALPPGPIDVRFSSVGFRYPTGPPVLHDIELTIAAQARVAVVGETGAGKTTLAKLLTRLMDPTEGKVLLSGVPVDRVSFASLRRRLVMVPQDGFLFDATIADNVRFGAERVSDKKIKAAFAEVGLADWLAGMPHGLSTRVGERGESLSVGERQLVALVRAHVAAPDLLVLDEATSAVDPATEVRLQRAMDAIMRGRTTITVAHRLSTAQRADEVIVVDAGRIVQRGHHSELIRDPDSVYGQLYAFWLEHTVAGTAPTTVAGLPQSATS